jgi:hypothetical protein
LLGIVDAWSNDLQGTDFYLNDNVLYDNKTTDYINETYILNENLPININMYGYISSSPYTKKYINQLWYR